MKIKRAIALLLCVVTFAMCAVSCAGRNDDYANVTVISTYNFDGGVGSEWLRAAADAFEEYAKDKEYETGKKGVKIKIDAAMNLNASTMATSGYNIYLDEVQTNVRRFATQGLLVDITDVVTGDLGEYDESGKTIESKIDETFRSTLKGTDGKYYGLPYYETYSGLTYDIETFEKYNLYIAAPDQNTNRVINKYGKAVKFIVNKNMKKSCGNDGIYGTEDDGLPTSMIELLSLCEMMKNGGSNISPFQIIGMPSGRNYSSYLVNALWASLAGYDDMRTAYTFDNENLEVVVNESGNFSSASDFTSENLFTSIDYIKKPKTETISVTQDNGYRVYDMVERYYAMAFLEIVEKENWFSDDAYNDNVSHTGAQNLFIFSHENSKPMGMLIEGSYWYQESERTGSFDDYAKVSNGAERKLGWMSLPTSLYDSVEEGQGRKVTYSEISHSYVTLNAASVKNNSGLEQACKDFLKFMYTDNQLRSFTKITGIPKGAMNYTMRDEDFAEMSDFQKSIWEVRDSSNVVYSGTGENNTKFWEKQSTFEMSMNIGIYRPNFKGVQYDSYWSAMLWNEDDIGKNISKDLFEVGRLSASGW